MCTAVCLSSIPVCTSLDILVTKSSPLLLKVSDARSLSCKLSDGNFPVEAGMRGSEACQNSIVSPVPTLWQLNDSTGIPSCCLSLLPNKRILKRKSYSIEQNEGDTQVVGKDSRERKQQSPRLYMKARQEINSAICAMVIITTHAFHLLC